MGIIGLTDRGAAFPRVGILRKGAAKPNERQPGADLKDHFRFESDDPTVARAFAAAYGDKPNGIRVMFTSNHEDVARIDQLRQPCEGFLKQRFAVASEVE